MLRAVLIDDESSARNHLHRLLKTFVNQVKIVGEANTIVDGIALINDLKPKVVFLDIELPPYNGFELLNSFPKPNFSVIFTTAHLGYAIRAIRSAAADYLLKPIVRTELRTAINRVQERQALASPSPAIDMLKHNLERSPEEQKIVVSSLDEWVFIEKSEIIYLEAARRYTIVHTTKGEQLVSKPLLYFESVLPEPYFFRSHRSYLINLKYVQKLVKKDGGYIKMQNGAELKLSPALRDEFILSCKRFG